MDGWDDLEPIFLNFHKTIVEDDRLKSYFANAQTIEKVSDSLINHFKTLHTVSLKWLKNYYYELGRRHGALGIPYSTFEMVTDNMHHELLKYFLKTDPQKVGKLERYAYFMINNVAAGYFSYEKEMFQNRLRELNKYAQCTDMLKNYIEWFLMLHTVLVSGSESFSTELKKDKPTFDSVSEYEYGKILSNIRHLEKEFSIELTSITYYMDKGDFKHLLDGYHRLKECFFTITHVISVLEQLIMQNSNTKDVLTGALTRKRMGSEIERAAAVSISSGKPFCVVMADIDHFKKVNDTYGHKAGDMALKFFASTLMKHTLQAGCSVIRYGGEEFVIIVPEKDAEECAYLIENVRLIIEMLPVSIDSGMIHITSSFGIAASRPDRLKLPDPVELVKLADEKLYVAKQNGRNRVEK